MGLNKPMKLKTADGRRVLLTVGLGVASLLALSGCADSVTFDAAKTIPPVGFWYGFWHGLIAVFSFFVSLFDDKVAVYAIYNNGGWYDFGFCIGVGAFSNTASNFRDA